ncbi:MAG: ADP-ribose pyrophosphatase, partial [Dehalococcoidia bacterium]
MVNPERKLASQEIYHGRAVNLRVDTVQKAGGTETTREVVEHSDCVAVVVVDDHDKILLVRQFRHAVEKFLLEIPAGGIEPGEEP